MKRSTIRIPIFLACAGLLCFSGCTVLGGMLGRSIDHSGSPTPEFETEAILYDIEAGENVQVTLRDGSSLIGTFVGLFEPDRSTFLARAEENRVQTLRRIGVLQIGDTARLLVRYGMDHVIVYLGADSNEVWYHRLGEETILRESFALIEELEWNGGASRCTPPLEMELEEGTLQGIYDARFLTKSGIVTMPMAAIYQVTYERYPITGQIILGALGLGVDIALVVLLTADGEPPPRPAKPADKDNGKIMCGCPFLFGQRDGEWVFETECFSGAIFLEGQRTDWARLERTEEENGRIRLRMKNLLQEVDSIDQLTLLRIEHDAADEVYPTESGRMITAVPQPPLWAENDRGTDVLAQVRSDDADCWLAVPAAGEEESDARRWIELRFPAPEDADSVTLVLRVQNTAWGARMQAGFFSLFGDAMQQYHDLWNSDRRAAEDLHALLRSEGMLQVSVWDGGAWRTAGHVWEVGLSAYRAVAMRIPVADIRAGDLRIRLEAPAGIWMVGSVGVDASDPGAVNVLRIAAASARRLDDGSDCRSALTAEDREYLVLDTGEAADITFDVPDAAIPRGRAVTWIVESAGYYRMKLDESGPPAVETLTRIMTESGHFARISSQKFREAVAKMAEGKSKIED